MPVKFLITTLKPGVDPDEYERWVRERDYTFTRGNANVISYSVYRIEGEVRGYPSAGWRYVERLEVKDFEQHARDLATDAGQRMIRELFDRYVDETRNIHVTTEEVR